MAEETVRKTREGLKQENAALTAEITEIKKLSLAFYKGLEELLSESDRQGLKTLRAELSSRADVSPEDMSHKIAEYFSNKLAKEVPVVQDPGRIKALDDALKAIVPPSIYAEVMAEPDSGKWCSLLKRLYDERFFGPLEKEAEETKKTRMFAKESSEEAKRLKDRIASLEESIAEKDQTLAEYLQKAVSAEAEAKRLAKEKQLEFNARAAAEGNARDVEKKLHDAETMTGFAQQLQEEQVQQALADAMVAKAANARLEERYNALEEQHNAALAEVRHSQKLLDKQQEALDAVNSEKDKAQKALAILSCSEKLQKYHADLMNQIKTQPVFINLLLKAAEGMGKTRQDMSDPSKTTDLSENLDWLMLHLVGDVLPHAYDWDAKELKLEGDAAIAKVSLMKVLDVIKTYIPDTERNLLEQRIQESKQAEEAIQAAKGADKSQLKEPESISKIVSDTLRFVNMQWYFDNETLVETIFGPEKSEEYLAIKDSQKKAEWVQKNSEEFTEKYTKAAEAMADRKAADALAAKSDAESQRDALQQQRAEAELSYKEKMIELFALFPREIDADATDGVLAKMFVGGEGSKADTQDVSIENLKSTIERTVAQRAEYKQTAKTAEENLGKAHAVLGTISDELKQKEDYVKEIEESKSNLGQTISEQAAELAELEKANERILKESRQILTKKEEEFAALNEKIQKLESGAGFQLTDFVSKADYDAKIREKEEEIAVLKKISDGHISRDEHDAGVKAKEDEVRDEYLPVVVDQKKQIADLKDKMSELEKTLADKENTPGVLAAAFTDDAIANELADLRQQLEAANKRTVYNPDVHMPKSEHDAVLAAANANVYNPDVHMPKAENERLLADVRAAADAETQAALAEQARRYDEDLAGKLAAKEAEVRNEYKPAVDRKEELEQKVREQQAVLDGKAAKIVRLEKDLESARSAKVEAEAILTGVTPYDPLKHMTKEEHDAALAAAKAGALNPVDYILKSGYEKALADANAASAEEKRVALEKRDAEARQSVDEKQGRIAELEGFVQGKATELEQLRTERAALIIFDSNKHTTVEKYNADLAKKEEQLRAKQGEFDALSQSKSGIETELAAAKQNVYNPDVHMPKVEHDRLLVEAKHASAEEQRIALEHKDAEAKRRVDEKQNRIAELERIVNEKDAQIAGAVLYDSSKHVKKEDHEKIVGEQKSAYEAQIAGKQDEIKGLASSKSGLENELGQVKGRADTAERDKARLEIDLTNANANAYNPDKHMTKNDHQSTLETAQKAYAAETDQIKARIKELEGQVAAVQQKISECKDESLQKLMNAAERMAGLLKENREMYAKLNPKGVEK